MVLPQRALDDCSGVRTHRRHDPNELLRPDVEAAVGALTGLLPFVTIVEGDTDHLVPENVRCRLLPGGDYDRGLCAVSKADVECLNALGSAIQGYMECARMLVALNRTWFGNHDSRFGNCTVSGESEQTCLICVERDLWKRARTTLKCAAQVLARAGTPRGMCREFARNAYCSCDVCKGAFQSWSQEFAAVWSAFKSQIQSLNKWREAMRDHANRDLKSAKALGLHFRKLDEQEPRTEGAMAAWRRLMPAPGNGAPGGEAD